MSRDNKHTDCTFFLCIYIFLHRSSDDKFRTLTLYGSPPSIRLLNSILRGTAHTTLQRNAHSIGYGDYFILRNELKNQFCRLGNDNHSTVTKSECHAVIAIFNRCEHRVSGTSSRRHACFLPSLSAVSRNLPEAILVYPYLRSYSCNGYTLPVIISNELRRTVSILVGPIIYTVLFYNNNRGGSQTVCSIFTIFNGYTCPVREVNCITAILIGHHIIHGHIFLQCRYYRIQ